ncbi:JAB domain-containing protein [Chitinophaga sp. NPDC101104]|uniref:JAB domain-containing protein n=1 Tax=Chitinophaga sp. NPDC101104 TaxID=3390561 RepID=UPI003D046E5D
MQVQICSLNIVSEISVSFTPSILPSKCPKINVSNDIYEILKSNWNMGTFYLQEELKAVFLNHDNRVMGILPISVGTKTSCSCDLPKLLGAALKASCTKLILAHNHPSGSIKASKADIELTSQVNAACKLLNLKLLDHLILGDSGYCSMADEGLIL